MNRQDIIHWLLQSDVSIQYQVHRDLLNRERPDLRERIATVGWGALYLAARKPEGYWGKRFYQPKWISSHYTLLDLRNLCISPRQPLIRKSIEMIARNEKGEDGGINPALTVRGSDVCVSGMFLNYASYFLIEGELLQSVIDSVLALRMKDGGFNCELIYRGAIHSSMHSSLSVLEGLTEYLKNGYTYRLNEVEEAVHACTEFILRHRLFLSDRTGRIIHKDFLKLTYPGRWKYDILRSLDHLQYMGIPWDDRMQPAVDVLIQKRNKDRTWNLQAHHPGKRHIDMEEVGKSSRWNTLRAMRVMKHFGTDEL